MCREAMSLDAATSTAGAKGKAVRKAPPAHASAVQADAESPLVLPQVRSLVSS